MKISLTLIFGVLSTPAYAGQVAVVNPSVGGAMVVTLPNSNAPSVPITSRPTQSPDQFIQPNLVSNSPALKIDAPNTNLISTNTRPVTDVNSQPLGNSNQVVETQTSVVQNTSTQGMLESTATDAQSLVLKGTNASLTSQSGNEINVTVRDFLQYKENSISTAASIASTTRSIDYSMFTKSQALASIEKINIILSTKRLTQDAQTQLLALRQDLFTIIE